MNYNSPDYGPPYLADGDPLLGASRRKRLAHVEPRADVHRHVERGPGQSSCSQWLRSLIHFSVKVSARLLW